MNPSILRRLVPLGLALGLIVTAFVVDTSLVALPAPAKADAVDQRSARTTDSTTIPEPPAASPDPTDPDAVSVEIIVVESTPMAETLSTTGELRANEAVELRSEVDGRLAALSFDEGQHVTEGALLVKIHDADLQAELRRAEVERRLAQVREERSRKLLAEDTISQAVYDEAKGELDVVDARIATIAAEIAKTEIRAPFAGVIGLRSVSEGSYLTSSTPIATLQSLDPIKLDFSV
ncbi:MAG: efflux RND transporter periplasmic adaptor subunit, partial [Acidobacteriota bacterium]